MIMMKKKILGFILATVMTFTMFTACGSSNSESTIVDDEVKTAENEIPEWLEAITTDWDEWMITDIDGVGEISLSAYTPNEKDGKVITSYNINCENTKNPSDNRISPFGSNGVYIRKCNNWYMIIAVGQYDENEGLVRNSGYVFDTSLENAFDEANYVSIIIEENFLGCHETKLIEDENGKSIECDQNDEVQAMAMDFAINGLSNWTRLDEKLLASDKETAYKLYLENNEEIQASINEHEFKEDVAAYIANFDYSQVKIPDEANPNMESTNEEIIEDEAATEIEPTDELEEESDNNQDLKGWYGLTEASWQEYGMDLYLNFTSSDSGAIRDGDLGGKFTKDGNEYRYTTEFGTFTFTLDINSDGTLTYHCVDGTFTLEKCDEPS